MEEVFRAWVVVFRAEPAPPSHGKRSGRKAHCNMGAARHNALCGQRCALRTSLARQELNKPSTGRCNIWSSGTPLRLIGTRGVLVGAQECEPHSEGGRRTCARVSAAS